MNYDFGIDKIEELPILKELLDKNAALYIVGGFLRDKLLNKESFDIDFIVQNQNAVDLAKKFAQKAGYTFVMLDEKYEIARVVSEDKLHYFDFARCEDDNIETDLKRRDLTINSLAIQIFPIIKIIDINNSVNDIKNGIIRAVSFKNLTDDTLRMLRVFRFASTANFDIDNDLINFIKENVTLIKNSAQERINQEVLKFFEGENSSKYLILMKETGLLYEIFEVLRAEQNIPKNLHHHLCLIDHSIETVRNLELLLKNEKREYLEFFNEPIIAGYKRTAFLKIASLLHDVGKPSTWTIDEEGRHRFIGHDSIGAELLKPILKNMKYGKAQANYIITLVKNHIYPSQLARSEDCVSQKAINRFFRKLGNYVPDVIFLAMSDRLSARGEAITEEIVKNNLFMLKKYLDDYIEFLKTAKPLEKLLSGNEIADILNIPKDKNLGIIIDELKEAQISGDICTKEQAIEFIKTKK